jgi:peptidoglycan/xylan/chitin deacetylase (PgdA/CDA1 family)
MADGGVTGFDRRATRRRLLRGTGLVGAGVALGVTGFAELADVADRKLPLLPGPALATSGDRTQHLGLGRIGVNWMVRTEEKVLALTFDDGPRPQWTPMVLDTLDDLDVPATFFMVGRRVRKYARLIAGRMDRHEIGNHTWDHHDLARRAQHQAQQDLAQAHDAIIAVTGRVPTVFRPPYGHLSGSAVLAADHLGYEIVLWSLQMVESQFPNNPTGHARYMVSQIQPGTILLGHDVGPPDRLVALRGLPQMIRSLRGLGYEFVTVTQLLHRSPSVLT